MYVYVHVYISLHVGGVFGALIPETKISFEGDKYYGNGLVCVWTFVSGVFVLYRYDTYLFLYDL